MATTGPSTGQHRGVLHFFPGQTTLIWAVPGTAPLIAAAKGGEEPKPGDPSDKVMTPHRTTAGSFIIHSYGPYHTKTWQLSRIVWGAALKTEGPRNLEKVYYWSGGHHGQWRLVVDLVPMATTKWIRWAYDTLYAKNKALYDKDQDGIPDRWLFNDFGPLAVRYFRDKNHDGKLDGDEHLSGEMLHTVQLNEAQTDVNNAAGRVISPITLTSSHGCIHVAPKDRDRFHDAGAFRRGTAFIVHRYNEKVPPKWTAQPPG
jgi:hypothetical protein